MKIKKFMDEINKMIKMQNRFINRSFLMYDLVKCIILAEINSTVEEKTVPIGSKIIGI